MAHSMTVENFNECRTYRLFTLSCKVQTLRHNPVSCEFGTMRNRGNPPIPTHHRASAILWPVRQMKCNVRPVAFTSNVQLVVVVVIVVGGAEHGNAAINFQTTRRCVCTGQTQNIYPSRAVYAFGIPILMCVPSRALHGANMPIVQVVIQHFPKQFCVVFAVARIPCAVRRSLRMRCANIGWYIMC